MDNYLLAPVIDHTALKPETTSAQVETLCREAHRYGFASVCVMPLWVSLARRTLDALASSVVVCTTVGFPNGNHATRSKVTEAALAIAEGAREIDMVMAVGALKSGDDAHVLEDIRAVVVEASRRSALVKVIIETCLLTEEEKRRACAIVGESGADYIKTSTGFAGGGATVEDVMLLRRLSPPEVQVKASGGIRDRETALAMIAAGATRIGTSAGGAIVAVEGTRQTP